MKHEVITLPPEVLRRLWQSMSPKTQVAFISTCKPLYNEHSLDVLCARLQAFARKKSPVILALQPHKTRVRRRVEYATYPDENDANDTIMEPGSRRYKKRVKEDWVFEPKEAPDHALAKPFVFFSAHLSAARDDIELRVAFPEYAENTADEAEVLPDGAGVALSRTFVKKLQDLRAGAPFSYKEALKTGCIFEAVRTSNALRRWWMYACYECGGARSICPGCGGVSTRWHEAFASCGYQTPCPMCVGYGAAIAATELIRDAIDETYGITCVLVKRWSKEEWDAKTGRKKLCAVVSHRTARFLMGTGKSCQSQRSSDHG